MGCSQSTQMMARVQESIDVISGPCSSGKDREKSAEEWARWSQGIVRVGFAADLAVSVCADDPYARAVAAQEALIEIR
jgi:hypothetical protein